MFKTVEGELKVIQQTFLESSSKIEEKFRKYYMDTGACILSNQQFNVLIKQERVLSQEAVKIKANEK